MRNVLFRRFGVIVHGSFSFHFLSEYHDGAVDVDDDDEVVCHGRSVIQSHKIARGCGLMRNYGINFAKTTSLPTEVLCRAEQLVQKLIVSTEVKNPGLEFTKLYRR